MHSAAAISIAAAVTFTIEQTPARKGEGDFPDR
jgi:hypothetical protein